MSNLIKHLNYVPLEDKKVIDVFQKTVETIKDELPLKSNKESESNQVAKKLLEEAQLEIQSLKQQLNKQEEYAQSLMKQATEEAEQIKKKAEEDINQWWEERRKLDSEHMNEAQKNGFDQGYQEGMLKAEASVKEEYAKILDESKSILEHAHIQKLQIIEEAEPFLIELSCAISKKIIQQQLTLSKEWIVELTKKTLSRKREQGMITLCVSPTHYSYIQDAREELALAIDSHAELQIFPDGSVEDHGCVIRSSFGSIDARIDTQLTEIKNALLQVAGNREDDNSND